MICTWCSSTRPSRHPSRRGAAPPCPGSSRRSAMISRALRCARPRAVLQCMSWPAVLRPRSGARQTLLENLSWRRDTWPGLRLQLEALNASDVPGISILARSRSHALAGHWCRRGSASSTSTTWCVKPRSACRTRHRTLGCVMSSGGRPPATSLISAISFEAFRRLHRAGYRGHIGYGIPPCRRRRLGAGLGRPLAGTLFPTTLKAEPLAHAGTIHEEICRNRRSPSYSSQPPTRGPRGMSA